MLAHKHATVAARLVARQRETVALLKVRGSSADNAERLLGLLEELHRLCIDRQGELGLQLLALMMKIGQGH